MCLQTPGGLQSNQLGAHTCTIHTLDSSENFWLPEQRTQPPGHPAHVASQSAGGYVTLCTLPGYYCCMCSETLPHHKCCCVTHPKGDSADAQSTPEVITHASGISWALPVCPRPPQIPPSTPSGQATRARRHNGMGEATDRDSCHGLSCRGANTVVHACMQHAWDWRHL